MVNRSVVRIALVSALLVLSVNFIPYRQAATQSITPASEGDIAPGMNRIAEGYVRLALAVGQHDASYIDAYYGPEAWQAKAKEEKKTLREIEETAAPLLGKLERLDVSRQDEMVQLRHRFLIKQLGALVARVRMLEGAKLSFDEESEALYDAVAPRYGESHFTATLSRIDSLLPPGEGSLVERLARFKRDFIIPKDKLNAVFTAAIEEARKRTRQHIALPANESFVVEYVTNKSWGAYNWYKGNGRSVIQVNTDLPTYIESAVGWACHEGYPGHHVYNVLLEEHLAKGRGWVEFTVYPLYSPQSLIAEGTANYGIAVVFPGEERLAFERDVLYPMAGLDPAKADAYDKVLKLVRDLHHAENEAARRYLNGEITGEQAAEWLSSCALMPIERARKLVSFFDQYRSYIINYNVGYGLVKSYIERKGGAEDKPQKRWDEFTTLLLSPRIPSGLK